MSGSETAVCDFCQTPIPEKEFERGVAVIVLGRRYCARCKDRAIERSRSRDAKPEFLTPPPRPLLEMPREDSHGSDAPGSP